MSAIAGVPLPPGIGRKMMNPIRAMKGTSQPRWVGLLSDASRGAQMRSALVYIQPRILMSRVADALDNFTRHTQAGRGHCR